MMRRCLYNDRGIALLLAVTVISLLVGVTVQFNRDMRRELTGSTTILQSAHMNAMVRSGVNIGEAVLLKDGEENSFDTYHDPWALLGEATMSQFYSSGKLEVNISDLSGRIQLNSLVPVPGAQGGSNAQAVRAVLLRLLLSGEFGDLSDEDATLIVDAITDWIDEDDNESGIEETESSYYFSRSPSYGCKNGPMEFVEELLLVRGITSAMYFGNEEFAGLRDYVTVHGNDGRININTAPPLVLRALHDEMSDEMVEGMTAFRQNPENKELLQDVNWYANIPEVSGDVQLDGKLISTESRYFRLLSRAEINQMEKTRTTFVERDAGGKIKHLYTKID